MQIETMRARNQRERGFQVGAQFIRCARPARMVTRRLYPATRCTTLFFKPNNIIALPAMHRNGDIA